MWEEGRRGVVVAVALTTLLIMSATSHAYLETNSARDPETNSARDPEGFRAGAAAVPITPAGSNPAWKGWVHPATGIWSEEYSDLNGNGRWDQGEPFVDDPYNTRLDPGSAGKFDGIFIAGFGNNRAATGVHDDLWARAVVIDDGEKRVALVALDTVGWFFEDVERVRAMLKPEWGIDLLVVGATHNHQSPDTMGLWGHTLPLDGKFPRYMEFLRRQVVDAVGEAVGQLRPALLRAVEAPTDPELVADFRDPLVHDDVVRALQLREPGRGTIATIVNYSSHAESLGGGNTLLTSDFPHYVRARLEERLGGVALFYAGAIGGILGPLTQFGEVGGKEPWKIPLYDQACAPVPGAFAEHDTFEKARSIGCSVANSALAALEGGGGSQGTDEAEGDGGAEDADGTEDEDEGEADNGDPGWGQPDAIHLATRELWIPNDNWMLRTFNGLGMFDKPTYTAQGLPAGPTVVGDYFRSEMAYVSLGAQADLITVPGELFPEMANGGYGRPGCPQAHTGAPFEPPIRPNMHGKVRFILGLGQDELGYIVPKYDFYISGTPTNELRLINFLSLNPDRREFGWGAADPCGYESGTRHYEETVSGSSVLAPIVACAAIDLLGGRPESHAACDRANMRGRPLGLQRETPVDNEIEDAWRGER